MINIMVDCYYIITNSRYVHPIRVFDELLFPQLPHPQVNLVQWGKREIQEHVPTHVAVPQDGPEWLT